MDYRNTDCHSQCAHWLHNVTWQGARCGGRPQGSPLRKHKGCNASPGGTMWASSPTGAQHEVRTGPAQRCYPGGSVIFRDRERVRRFCRSSSCTSCRCRREIAEAPPVADAARRFRGSAPIGGHDSGRESAGTTVLPRRLSRIIRDKERVRHSGRSNSYTFYRSRRGTGRYGRSSAPGGAAFSRCRHRRCSRRWP